MYEQMMPGYPETENPRPTSPEKAPEEMALSQLKERATYIVTEDVQLNGHIGENGPLELSQAVRIPEGAALTVEKYYPSVAVGDDEGDGSDEGWLLAVDTPEDSFKVLVYANDNFDARLKIEKN